MVWMIWCDCGKSIQVPQCQNLKSDWSQEWSNGSDLCVVSNYRALYWPFFSSTTDHTVWCDLTKPVLACENYIQSYPLFLFFSKGVKIIFAVCLCSYANISLGFRHNKITEKHVNRWEPYINPELTAPFCLWHSVLGYKLICWSMGVLRFTVWLLRFLCVLIPLPVGFYQKKTPQG